MQLGEPGTAVHVWMCKRVAEKGMQGIWQAVAAGCCNFLDHTSTYMVACMFAWDSADFSRALPSCAM